MDLDICLPYRNLDEENASLPGSKLVVLCEPTTLSNLFIFLYPTRSCLIECLTQFENQVK